MLRNQKSNVCCEPPHKYGVSPPKYGAHLRNMVKPPQRYGAPTSEFW